MVLLHQTGGPPELQVRNLKMTSPESLAQIQNNFTEFFLCIPSTNIAQWLRSAEQKTARDPDKIFLNGISS